MDRYWPYYFAISGVVYFAAVWAVVLRREEFLRLYKGYFRFLLVPWRAILFVMGAGFMVFIAPYTGDPTWDYFDAFFMSALTFVTAPWAVGVLFRSAIRANPLWTVLPAICIWHFSASLSYDAYILFKMKTYPSAWFDNMLASSFLYGMGGLMWSAQWTQGRKLHFAFQDAGWPAERGETSYGVMALGGIIAAVLGSVIIYVFLV